MLLHFPFFQMTKARLKMTLEELKALQWEHEVLEQRFEKVRALCQFFLFILNLLTLII